MIKRCRAPGPRRTQKDYSFAFKLQVVAEVEKGEYTYRQAQSEYGIQGRSTVLKWLRKYGILDWKNRKDGMRSTKQANPKTEIRRLERELERTKAEVAVLQTAFKIAEKELGVDLRKKYLAKLSKQTDNKGRILESGGSADCLAAADKAITNPSEPEHSGQNKTKLS